jgi:hypothetical protein
MADPVSLSEAKAFLRVTHDDEDAPITTFLAAAKARIESETGLSLDETSPAPLRLAILYLVAQSYGGRGEINELSAPATAWISPYKRIGL